MDYQERLSGLPPVVEQLFRSPPSREGLGWVGKVSSLGDFGGRDRGRLTLDTVRPCRRGWVEGCSGKI